MLSTLVDIATTAQRLLGRSFRAWSEWAEREPAAAALQLLTVSKVLRYRADARRRPQGWLARRDRSIARALREQAHAMRDTARRESACAARPGTWGR